MVNKLISVTEMLPSGEWPVWAVWKVLQGRLAKEDVVEEGVMSLTTFRRIAKQIEANGGPLDLTRRPKYKGKASTMPPEALELLRITADMFPDLFLNDYQKMLVEEGFAEFTLSILSRTFKRMGYTTKKLSRYASEQSLVQRLEFMQQIGRYDAAQLVFVDESSFDKRTNNRRRGRSLKGKPAYARTSIKRGQRYSLLPAISLDRGVFAVRIEDDSISGNIFMEWLLTTLLPQMDLYPLPSSVIVLDNCSVHKHKLVKKLVEAAGELVASGARARCAA